MNEEINTHDLIIDFGKHKGERWTRVPVSYLTWLGNQVEENENVKIARAELARRGSTYPTIEISGHAVDRASLQCRKIWHDTRGREEGLNSWLIRMSNEALVKGKKFEDNPNKYRYLGMKFVFEFGEFYPTLKTINKV
jgi:hypothetical protein